MKTKHPNILEKYWDDHPERKQEIYVGEFIHFMDYIAEINEDIATKLFQKVYPEEYTKIVISAMPAEDAFKLFEELNISLEDASMLEEFTWLKMKQGGHYISKSRIRDLLPKAMKCPIEDLKSPIVEIGGKEYYIGRKLTDEAKTEYEYLKNNQYVQDNLLTLLQQQQAQIENLEKNLKSSTE